MPRYCLTLSEGLASSMGAEGWGQAAEMEGIILGFIFGRVWTCLSQLTSFQIPKSWGRGVVVLVLVWDLALGGRTIVCAPSASLAPEGVPPSSEGKQTLASTLPAEKLRPEHEKVSINQ